MKPINFVVISAFLAASALSRPPPNYHVNAVVPASTPKDGHGYQYGHVKGEESTPGYGKEATPSSNACGGYGDVKGAESTPPTTTPGYGNVESQQATGYGNVAPANETPMNTPGYGNVAPAAGYTSTTTPAVEGENGTTTPCTIPGNVEGEVATPTPTTPCTTPGEVEGENATPLRLPAQPHQVRSRVRTQLLPPHLAPHPAKLRVKTQLLPPHRASPPGEVEGENANPTTTPCTSTPGAVEGENATPPRLPAHPHLVPRKRNSQTTPCATSTPAVVGAEATPTSTKRKCKRTKTHGYQTATVIGDEYSTPTVTNKGYY
ncbi:hypothetical protein BJ742DRAFT_768964 [Cladochytrium replicatum]|nr:hypothetical protein BJ742DRAFT_768964 [Cladochytrium replicatum]